MLLVLLCLIIIITIVRDDVLDFVDALPALDVRLLVNIIW